MTMAKHQNLQKCKLKLNLYKICNKWILTKQIVFSKTVFYMKSIN